MTALQAAQYLHPEAGLTDKSTDKDIFEAIINVDEFFAVLPNIIESLKGTEVGQSLAEKAVSLDMPPEEFKKSITMMAFSSYMQAKLRILRETMNK